MCQIVRLYVALDYLADLAIFGLPIYKFAKVMQLCRAECSQGEELEQPPKAQLENLLHAFSKLEEKVVLTPSHRYATCSHLCGAVGDKNGATAVSKGVCGCAEGGGACVSRTRHKSRRLRDVDAGVTVYQRDPCQCLKPFTNDTTENASDDAVSRERVFQRKWDLSSEYNTSMWYFRQRRSC